MPQAAERKRTPSVQDALDQVRALLQKHRIVESMVRKQDMPRHELVESLVHKQNLVELQKKLDRLHPADVAYILEALPLEERLDLGMDLPSVHTMLDAAVTEPDALVDERIDLEQT